MFSYKFCIEVEIDGKQRPAMKFGNAKDIEHLVHLAHGYMASSLYVSDKVLEGIREVLNGEKEVHHFSGDDWCIVSFRKNSSLISNGMDVFEPFEIESYLIQKLVQDWYDFLQTWENGKIPGLRPPLLEK